MAVRGAFAENTTDSLIAQSARFAIVERVNTLSGACVEPLALKNVCVKATGRPKGRNQTEWRQSLLFARLGLEL
jgi:hypothetical protein